MPARGTYGGQIPAAAGGGRVASVDAGSPAQRAGVVVGDLIVAVDGQTLRDIIDWQWLTDSGEVVLGVRHGETVREEMVRRAPGEGWGVGFADAVFDGVRTCRNRCAFCFMAQLPRGLRRALYLRDDDYRLSFLQGNFVTLTNLANSDVERICEQALSPLYVSLHAVDAAVRAKLVCAREDRALDRFDELLACGIDLHVQIAPGDFAKIEATVFGISCRRSQHAVGARPRVLAERFLKAAVPDDLAPNAAVAGVVDVLQEVAVDLLVDLADNLVSRDDDIRLLAPPNL